MSGFRRGLMANALDPLKVPLTFTAAEAGATVALNIVGELDISGMHYRMGKSGVWIPYTAGTVINLPNIGDACQFWNSAATLSKTTINHVRFALPKKVAATGNIQSLLNWRKDCHDGCFLELFYGSKLTSLPLMPARLLAFRSYYDMYGGYSKIYQPKLFLDMPLNTISCQHMFQFATGFESVELSGEYTSSGNISAMLRGCTSLKEITVHFTSWAVDTTNWVLAIPAGGTFYKPSALPEEYGASRIPEGWTVVNLD